MEPTTDLIVGLGEILWDLLPGGRQLGGAPFNFAFHCHQLGHPSRIVSRVGDDDLGVEIRARLAACHLADVYLQHDADHSTGTVRVDVDTHGQPTFTIAPDAAYDHLAWDQSLAGLFPGIAAVCFGTLIQRHPSARATVQHALRTARRAVIVYDVNLRQDFFNRDIIEDSLYASGWVKLNDEELLVLREMLRLPAPPSAALAEIRRRYHLELACLTRGARGCLVQTAQEEVDLPGLQVNVVDTVGAGDAFTAGLLVYTLERKPLRDAADFANRLAAQVAASAGGTPVIRRTDFERSGDR